ALVNDLLFAQNIETDVAEVEKILNKIQHLDPPGIAARNLQECLLLQLNRKDQKDENVILAQKIIKNYCDEFVKKHYDKLCKSLKITEAQLKKAIELIVKLTPKPGEQEYNTKSNYIIPDFTVTNVNGHLDITLNSRNMPDLRISRSYMDTLKSYEKNPTSNKHIKDSVQFIKQKIDSAKWFIDSIKQRQETLLKTMHAIVYHQKKFFLDGEETSLKPMILKNIADAIGMDISTISRVANSKFVETEFGTYSLKFFFSEGVANEDGEEVSNKEIKKILSDCIGAENKSKPLPDEALMEILKSKGYNIARRTVAKYREQLGIPVARLRKEMK
ncbi:MAG: RNA polymerase factor sigma-54, partial [Bacteroidetes bacterium]|nr:RNA polymerase factor sigma-54 [Bacteroidota bacterium]